MARKSTTERSIDSFFKQCGLGAEIDPRAFWQIAAKRHKRAAALLEDCIEARERGEDCNPYPLKNESLAFANMVASQFDSAKLRSVATWLLQEQLPFDGHRTLEVGCDNGILLCLLASLHPNGQFVGIDFCEEAILLARQRAKHFELRNIEFAVASLTPEISVEIGAGYDIVLAVTVFHEILPGRAPARQQTAMARGDIEAFSLEDVDRHLSHTLHQTPILATLQELLADDGVFISVDRWSDSRQKLRWIRLAGLHGLAVSLRRSSLLQFHSQGGMETMPLTVFGKRPLAPPSVSEILAFLSYRKVWRTFLAKQQCRKTLWRS